MFLSLCKTKVGSHCVKLSVFGLILIPIFAHSHQNNSEYGHFSRSEYLRWVNVALNYYLALIYLYLLISVKVIRTAYFSRLIKINKKTSFPESSVSLDILRIDKKCHSFHLKNVHFRILLNLVVLKTFGLFPRKYPCLESFYYKIAPTNQSHCFKGYLSLDDCLCRTWLLLT